MQNRLPGDNEKLIPPHIMREIIESLPDEFKMTPTPGVPMSYDFNLYADILFREVQGKVYYILVTGSKENVQLDVNELESLESCSAPILEVMPDHVAERLKAKTRDVKDIVYDMQKTLIKLEQMTKDYTAAQKNYESTQKRIEEMRSAIRIQKRQLRKLIEMQGIKVKPGSPISKLLRIDNWEASL